jgi:hypothetical protein
VLPDDQSSHYPQTPHPNESLAFVAFLAPAPAEDDEVGPPPAYVAVVELAVVNVENTSIVEVELLLGGCSIMTKLHSSHTRTSSWMATNRYLLAGYKCPYRNNISLSDPHSHSQESKSGSTLLSPRMSQQSSSANICRRSSLLPLRKVEERKARNYNDQA